LRRDGSGALERAKNGGRASSPGPARGSGGNRRPVRVCNRAVTTGWDLPRMRYLSLGETDLIAASCHWIELAGTGLVLDAGMDPEQDGPAALPPFGLLADRAVDHV